MASADIKVTINVAPIDDIDRLLRETLVEAANKGGFVPMPHPVFIPNKVIQEAVDALGPQCTCRYSFSGADLKCPVDHMGRNAPDPEPPGGDR